MSDDLRRRRRLTSNGPRRSTGGGNNWTPWLWTIVAALVVIAAGWFLGQGLAHVFGGSKNQTAQVQPTGVPPVTPLPSPAQTAAATPEPSPTISPEPTATPAAKPTHKAAASVAASPVPTLTMPPTPTPAPSASLAATATPEPISTATAAARVTQPIARRPEATASAASSANGSSAADVVRGYIEALRRGDPQSAAQYLGNGSPDESFIDPQTRIESITSTPNSDGSYKVEADMRTSKGEFYETFTVAQTQTGNRILDKTYIKP